MSDHGLSINRVAVHRVRGVPRRHGFTIDNLSAAINVIYGPNGSGKSTTARCLQEVLWPTSTGMERPSLVGEFSLDGHSWNVELDAGHPQVRRDGEQADAPPILPPEHRHRYHLALHELLQKEGAPQDFAKIIAEESRGGYDLGAAASALGFQENPKSPRKERQKLDQAKETRQKARRQHEELEQSAQELDARKEEHEQAREAERRLAEITRAIEYHETESKRQELQSRLEQYPPAMFKLRGDERESLDRLAKQQEHQEEQQAEEENTCREAEQAIEKAALSGDGVDSVTLDALKEQHSNLSEIEADMGNKELDLSEAQAKAQNAAREIGEHTEALQEDKIQKVPIPELDNFLNEAERVRAQNAVLEEKDRWLTSETPENIASVKSQQLRDGFLALSRWLSTPPQGPRNVRQIYWAFLISATLSVALCVVLGFLHGHIGWWIGAGVLFIVWTALAWIHRNALYQAPESGDRSAHQKSYGDTGLEPPKLWQSGPVSRKIRDLVELLADRQLEDERQNRREELSRQQEALKQDQQKLERRRRAVEEELGIELPVDDLWFSQLTARIDRWLSAREDVLRIEATLADLRKRRDEYLRTLSEKLSSYGYSEIDSSAAADAAITNLEQQDRDYRQAVQARADAQRRLHDNIQPALKQIDGERAELFDRLGLDASEEHKVDEWLKNYDEFGEIQQELSRVTAVAENQKEALADKEHLLDSDLAELRQQREDAEARAAKKDELQKQIVEIEQQIESAKKGHDLADALAAEEEARAQLLDARHKNRSALVGHTITQWVRTEAIENTRPQVFRRASEILQEFTNHTLELEIDDRSGTAEFRARRIDGSLSPLGELSGGERLQVLIAVRMAFVEQDERAKLPLLLDETLGTSDDTRAGVIIDSIIDLARDGRQVFYFTAQYDEVAKWKEKLDSSNVESRLVDLAELRSESIAEMTPLVVREVERPEPPEPGDRSYKAYGERLRVPGLDPLHTTSGEVHVWHLLENTDDLYRVLKMGISSWGQLRNAQEVGQSSVIGEELYQRAAAAAKAIDAAFDAWRIGRGKPVDRAVLEQSGAVSDNFIEEVSQLAKKLDGDGASLINALESGEVNRWRQDKTDELRAYLLDNGYLATEDPLDHDDIRIRVVAAVKADLEDGLIDEWLVDRIVGALPD